MRIAFYAPLKAPTHGVPSGDRRMARLLMRLLNTAGHGVELASELRSYALEESIAAQEIVRAEGQAEIRRLVERWRGRADRRPDLWFTYHLYYRAPDWIGPAVAEALAIPYVVAEASFASKRAGGLWALGHDQTEKALAAASTVFCLSQVDRPALAKANGFSARIVDLPPFIDAAEAPRPSRDEARRALGLEGDGPLLLAAGMMRQRAKLESYRQLAGALCLITDRPWRLAVAGDGPARGEVGEAFNRLGDGRVVWLGALPAESMALAYAAADLFVWPGVGEAYGMVYLEAQACGLATVAMDYSGVANVVRDGISGRLVAAGDESAFAAVVAGLLDDPGARSGLGASAGDFVRAERSLEQAGAIVDGILRELRPVA